jgi:hypothetical protein
MDDPADEISQIQIPKRPRQEETFGNIDLSTFPVCLNCAAPSDASTVIDLTEDTDESQDISLSQCAPPINKISNPNDRDDKRIGVWPCSTCTYENDLQHGVPRVCAVCNTLS